MNEGNGLSMKKLLKELQLRQSLKQNISTKIQELFIIETCAVTFKKQPIQTLILQQTNLNWNPRNIILINECLEEAGVKTTKSKGFYHFTNIFACKIPASSIIDAGKQLEHS